MHESSACSCTMYCFEDAFEFTFLRALCLIKSFPDDLNPAEIELIEL